MKSYSTEAIRPAMPRFHLRQSNGLYWPITFVFVTERMGREIMQERQLILDAMPPSDRKKQEALFRRYDPEVSVQAFQGTLRLFGIVKDS
ncbi:MAG: hypothetical protein IPQ01_07460 [Zoogloea sp.]|nr:hypothetical protein [Zoogloea sp.]